MIYFITGNKNKLAEVISILGPGKVEQMDIDLPEIQEVDARKIIEAKLEEARKHHDGEFIVEDTSLYFEATPGLPGPLIKWFMKTLGNNGMAELVHKYDNKGAYAVNLLGHINQAGEINFFEGRIDGVIVEPRGENGFGWDSIFQPAGKDKTFAEMTQEEKDEISHRKIALEKLKAYLNETKKDN